MNIVVSIEGSPVGSGVGLVSKSCSVVLETSCRDCSAPARNFELQVREGEMFEFLERRGAEVEMFLGDLIAGERAYV